MPKLAYFISPHGFGHAARSAAIIESLGRRVRDLEIEILTSVPEWFFSQSLNARYSVHHLLTDIGLIQHDAVSEDLPATVRALETFWQAMGSAARATVERWGGEAPDMVVSDISPLGLEVARLVGCPSILVENFTWDWIYGGYLEREPGLEEFAARSAQLNETATVHIQCEPVCRRANSAITVGPVSRMPRADRLQTRQALGLEASDTRPLALFTMGGMGWSSKAPAIADGLFVVTLGGGDELQRSEHGVRLPDRSPIYPPDLMWAADAVVAKLGYSTVAECHGSGARFGFIGRPGFVESAVLERWVRENMSAVAVDLERLRGSDLESEIGRVLALPQGRGSRGTGADEIADRLAPLL